MLTAEQQEQARVAETEYKRYKALPEGSPELAEYRRYVEYGEMMLLEWNNGHFTLTEEDYFYCGYIHNP